MEDKIKRMKELIDTLNHASKMYYQFSTPIMTDFEYDRLYDELVVLENETKTVFSNSLTINVEKEISISDIKLQNRARRGNSIMVINMDDYIKEVLIQ